jgi:phosphoribosylanthranilate isomerase
MEPLRLKVCGMREPEAGQVSKLGLDYIGFIFYPASPRFVGHDFTFKSAGEPTQTVGVFVNEERATIVKSLNQIGSRIAQLHGSESPDQCEALRDLGYTVIKALAVGDAFDESMATKYGPVVDYLLFDTRGKFHGGNATKFNWEILRRYDQRTPFFLSGGIALGDLAEINKLRDMNLHAIDMNSGLESAPGVKDVNKVIQAKELINKL